MGRRTLRRNAISIGLLAVLLPVLAACNSTALSSVPTAAPTVTVAPVATAADRYASATPQENANDPQVDSSATIKDNSVMPAVGDAAPDFSLLGIDGKTYSLSSLKGKVVVLEFIATW